MSFEKHYEDACPTALTGMFKYYVKIQNEELVELFKDKNQRNPTKTQLAMIEQMSEVLVHEHAMLLLILLRTYNGKEDV